MIKHVFDIYVFLFQENRTYFNSLPTKHVFDIYVCLYEIKKELTLTLYLLNTSTKNRTYIFFSRQRLRVSYIGVNDTMSIFSFFFSLPKKKKQWPTPATV